MADVFLSYAKADAAAAERVAEAIGNAGRSVWFDRELPAHRAYSDVIEGELQNAKAVLVLWSKRAVESQWVRSEANRARELGKLVQARIDNARLPMPFDQIQCADLGGRRRGRGDSGWAQVERSIAALVGGSAAESTPLAALRSGRRELLIGGGAAATAALAGGWWLLGRRAGEPAISPAVAALMGQARTALRQNTREGQNQAIAIYRQVVETNPDFAEAWGRLSLSYAWTSHWRQSSEGQMMRTRALSAAEQSLSLDPKEPHALVGRASAVPYLGNWLRVERGVRAALEIAPKSDETALSLALVLSGTGRNREGIGHMRSVIAAGPSPGIYVFYAQMLWAVGQQEQLDQVLDEAVKLYPTHLGIWFTRFYTAMMSGRPQQALALGADRTNWPTNLEPWEIESVIRVARAIESRSPPDVDAVAGEWLERARHGAGYAENAVQFMAALGRMDTAFAVLRAYHFSEGFDCGELRFTASQGTYTPRNDRLTGFLFNPVLAPLRADARFTRLLEDLRLTHFWRVSGTRPDYLAGQS